MEAILTPLIKYLLQRYIVSASGTSTRELAFSLRDGGLLLQNLELNLGLPADLPLTVQRAYVGELSLQLGNPIEVRACVYVAACIQVFTHAEWRSADTLGHCRSDSHRAGHTC
jgi:hypothetical protein